MDAHEEARGIYIYIYSTLYTCDIFTKVAIEVRSSLTIIVMIAANPMNVKIANGITKKA